jgi:hypothetical protein
MASTGSIVFAITARDLASKSIGAVNKQLGKLGTAGKIAKIGLAATAAALTTFAKIAFEAIQAAAEDELSTVRLTAALKARGIATDGLNAKIQEQITALGELGFVDDQVRAGIETGSRFFKNQESLLKANAVAANIAAVTGQDLSTVILAIGRGVQGSTRGLTTLGIKVKEGAKLQDILAAATAKYGGIAQEVANTTAGKYRAAQIKFNEAFERLGYTLLPIVNKVLDKFSTDILPGIEAAFATLGPVITDIADNYISPFIDSVDQLIKALGGENGLTTIIGILDAALTPFRITLTALKILIDAIVTGIKTIQGYQAAGLMPDGSFNPYLAQANTMGIGPAPVSLKVNFSIGTQKQDELVAGALGRMGTGSSRNK